MDNLISAIGTLGAYFAILLVLAVAVETILDPFTLFRGLRKKVNPEDLMKDLKEWGPSDSTGQQIVQTIVETTEGAQRAIQASQEITEAVAKAAEAITPTADDVRKKLLTSLQTIRSQYDANEQQRIVFLRVLSAIIGIALAVMLQIDTFALLADLLPKEALAVLSTPPVHIGGMVLTGLAASAGSSFWHDQLARIRALKEASQQVQTATNR